MSAHSPGAPAPILLAFSGGLDTSFCVPWLTETYGRPVVTVTVNTGGIDDAAAAALAARALALGAVAHHLVDARREYFERVLKWLLVGNVRRGQLYPLCVGAERTVQAQVVAAKAIELGSATIAHGCTAAGNDQVRFEVALRTLAPDIEILAPVRDRAFKRPEQLAYLEATRPAGAAARRGVLHESRPVGRHDRRPRDAHLRGQHPRIRLGAVAGRLRRAARAEAAGDRFRARRSGLARRRGAGPGRAHRGRSRRRRDPYGIGRGIHLGDTIIGTKGRVAFEAPAAAVLIEAHRELEKLVLSARQQRVKDLVAAAYGDLVHEGQNLDPVCRDIEALFASSQARVTGTVTVLLRQGSAFVEGVESPHSLMKASRGVYGEAAGEWTPEDARGFSKMLSLPGLFWSRANP